MYTIYLEPKWPLFWLEKSLFWGLTFKNRGHIEKYDYMHICIPWSLGMLMGQTNQATTDSWPILHHWGNKESECQLGNCLCRHHNKLQVLYFQRISTLFDSCKLFHACSVSTSTDCLASPSFYHWSALETNFWKQCQGNLLDHHSLFPNKPNLTPLDP